MDKKPSVLFVCMGNICRSPTGEGVFAHFAQKHGFADEIVIDSAGTINYHEGKPADARMRQAASRRGFDLASISRQLRDTDATDFDLVIPMDQSNLRNMQAWGPYQGKVMLLGEFLGYTPQDAPDVPDPYYGGEEGFETVLDMIEKACPAIAKELGFDVIDEAAD